MIEREREQIAESLLDGRLAERAADGWRVASAVQHHTATENALPVWIIFWERVA